MTRVLLACAVALTPLAACDTEESKGKVVAVRPVQALKVGDTSVLQKRWFPGRAKAANEVELSFRVGGTLLELPVKVGDQIKQDDVVARLDPATYQAEVDKISANLQRAKATLKNAELQRERQQSLFEKGHIAQAALDRYDAQESQSKADVAAQQAALKRAELDLGYTTLRAPFSGVIVATYVENYEDVQAKKRVVRLLDPGQIEMVVNVPESLISLAPQAKEAVVVFDAFPDLRVDARIKEIGAEASQTTRTYPVTLIMEQPEGVQILPGMAGKATAKRPSDQPGAQSVQVPPSALFAAGEDKSAVWVIDESSMTVVSRTVDPGELTGTGIEIRSGLKLGEWIVTAGANSLKKGQKVRILEQ